MLEFIFICKAFRSQGHALRAEGFRWQLIILRALTQYGIKLKFNATIGLNNVFLC